jgi:hypothetical protein
MAIGSPFLSSAPSHGRVVVAECRRSGSCFLYSQFNMSFTVILGLQLATAGLYPGDARYQIEVSRFAEVIR